jgi:hypothetical protein
VPRKNIEKRAAYQRQYYQRHIEKQKAASKKLRQANRQAALTYAKNYYQTNKIKLRAQAKKYRQDHKKERRQQQNIARRTNLNVKIHHNVSNLIRITIQRNGFSKNNNSIIQYLGYSINELKQHLEGLFESWMTWQNWGKYDPTTWIDNDLTTWTWQLDHIIPQSDLPYILMTDDNFQKCWKLSNLRPYSAKLNSIEGANRTRHIQSQKLDETPSP